MHNSKNLLNPDQIRTKLKKEVPNNVWELFEVAAIFANNLKMNAYLVGGCIRDFLMGSETSDWDIVVQGDGLELGKAIAQKLDGKIQKKSPFLTCTVFLRNNIKLDIATARSEVYKHPAALPEIKKSSINEDVMRRDFTINSLALKLNGEDAFNLIDKYKGLEDLNAKLIRVLHPKSFLDDPTRVFRALRFEQRFGFTLESETNRLLSESIKTKVFDRLSGFRFFNELKKNLQENIPTLCLQRSKEVGLLKCINPDFFAIPAGIELLKKIEKLLKETIPLENNPKSWKIYFLGILYSTLKESRKACLIRLDVKKKEAEFLLNSLMQVDKALITLDKVAETSPTIVYKTLHHLKDEVIYLLLALAKTSSVRTAVSIYRDYYRKQAIPKLKGEDLIKLGFAPGPAFQKIFKDLKKARLTGDIQTKSEEIDWVQKKFSPDKD